MSVVFPPAILRPAMAAPIYGHLALFVSFCWKTTLPIKFLVFGGVGLGFFGRGGGGSANFVGFFRVEDPEK